MSPRPRESRAYEGGNIAKKTALSNWLRELDRFAFLADDVGGDICVINFLFCRAHDDKSCDMASGRRRFGDIGLIFAANRV